MFVRYDVDVIVDEDADMGDLIHIDLRGLDVPA